MTRRATRLHRPVTVVATALAATGICIATMTPALALASPAVASHPLRPVRVTNHVSTLARVNSSARAKAAAAREAAASAVVTHPVTAGIAALAAAAAVSVAAVAPLNTPTPASSGAGKGSAAGSPAAAGSGPAVKNPPAPAAVPALSVQAPAQGVFGGASVWQHNDLGDAVTSNSAAMVADLQHEVTSLYGVAAFNVWKYNAAYYTAAPGAPRADVHWDDCQHKGFTPTGLLGVGGQFTAVPIPSNAAPAAGGDSEMTVSDPSTDQLWEFWQAKHEADGWHACWGGRIDHVSTSPGFFTNGFGASASGLAIGAGAVTLADVASGSINHALTLAIPDAADWKRYVYPAQRSDGGNTAADAIPLGTRLRLDPSLNIDSLGLSKIGAMIARAAQKYGFLVSDSSGAVAVSAESGAGVEAATGTNPWDAILGSTPDYLQLQNFPWSSLQALQAPSGH